MLPTKRYECEPRKRKAYLDAFDVISMYGIKRKDWNYKKFDISLSEMKEIWAFAFRDVEGKSRYVFVYEYVK